MVPRSGGSIVGILLRYVPLRVGSLEEGGFMEETQEKSENGNGGRGVG
jgi:hypothetical protein